MNLEDKLRGLNFFCFPRGALSTLRSDFRIPLSRKKEKGKKQKKYDFTDKRMFVLKHITHSNWNSEKHGKKKTQGLIFHTDIGNVNFEYRAQQVNATGMDKI